MTVAQALLKWLEDNGFGTRGTDLFIGSIPKEKNRINGWWIVGGGGTPNIRAETGEKGKQYIFSVFYRNTDSSDVDEKLQLLEETANNKECHELEGYETLDMEATGFQSDQDLDAEDRTVGVVEITVTIYQS